MKLVNTSKNLIENLSKRTVNFENFFEKKSKEFEDTNRIYGELKGSKDFDKVIKEIIDDMRPYLNADGGDVEFIKYEDNYVYIRLLGMCQGCAFADETIENGIFETIKKEIPEVKGIINVPL